MTTQFLTLKCPSCAAPLEVSNDMERFACGFCGTEQVVQRRGGTVALKILGDAISRVQVGTDRTAAELAIRRLRDDLASFEMQCMRKEEGHTQIHSLGGQWVLMGIGGGVVAILLFMISDWTIFSWIVLALSGFMFWVGGTSLKSSDETKRKREAEYDVERIEILTAIAEQERVLGKV